MSDQIKKLIDVKSIVTLVLTGVFAYLAIVHKISAEQFMTVFVMIMTYFFTKKSKDSEAKDPPLLGQMTAAKESGPLPVENGTIATESKK